MLRSGWLVETSPDNPIPLKDIYLQIHISIPEYYKVQSRLAQALAASRINLASFSENYVLP